MAVMDDIADELAIKALDLELKTGNEALIKKIADALASSSPTMEETFLTAVRIRRAEPVPSRRVFPASPGPADPFPEHSAHLHK